jgi:hypothetical protein
MDSLSSTVPKKKYGLPLAVVLHELINSSSSFLIPSTSSPAHHETAKATPISRHAGKLANWCTGYVPTITTVQNNNNLSVLYPMIWIQASQDLRVGTIIKQTR